MLKAFASRAQDWIDVESVAERCGDVLRWPLILEEIEPLAAAREAPEIVERLRRLQASA